MVLNAISKDGQIICPAELIAEGADQGDIFRLVRKQQAKEPYFCPECLGKYNQWIPVDFHRSTHVRCHFAHKRKTDKPCNNKVSESEKHLTAKRVIAKSLSIQHAGKLDGSSPHIDDKFFYGDGVASKRRPDVWLQFAGGAYEVHEVQLSRIDSAELDARTRDLRRFLRNEMMDASIAKRRNSKGFVELAVGQAASVHWYMSPRNLNDEIRAWAAEQNGVYLYRLTFDQDTHQPKWSLDQKLEKKKKKVQLRKSKATGRTSCNYKPAPIIENASWAFIPSQPPHLTCYTLFYDEAYERYATVFFDWRYTSSLAQFEWVPKNQLYQLNEPMPYHLHQHLMYVDYAKGIGPIRFQQLMEEKEDLAA